ncbi:hypothetical protein AAVH_33711, partial [Aphelenchoides avenae]
MSLGKRGDKAEDAVGNASGVGKPEEDSYQDTVPVELQDWSNSVIDEQTPVKRSDLNSYRIGLGKRTKDG